MHTLADEQGREGLRLEGASSLMMAAHTAAALVKEEVQEEAGREFDVAEHVAAMPWKKAQVLRALAHAHAEGGHIAVSARRQTDLMAQMVRRAAPCHQVEHALRGGGQAA